MANQDWRKVRLGDFVDLTTGYAFNSDEFTDNPEDVTLVKGSNVQQGFIDWDESKYWPVKNADEYERFRLEDGDVVIAMDRPWVQAGLKWAWIRQGDPEALLVQRIARLRSKNGLDQGFLRYLIGSKQFENYVRPIVTGVSIPHISGDQIQDFEFELPHLEFQRKASEVMSLFDHLISNNQRRLDIYEGMIKHIFREWFIEFNSPGHENLSLYDSGTEYQNLPDGWEVVKLSEVWDKLESGIRPKGGVGQFDS